MAPKASVPTVASIQKLLTRIGSATSGNKSVLLPRLSRDLKTRKMPLPNISSRFGKVRILSIDMGIKNLAFCVADVQMHILPEKTSDAFIHMDIQAWRRLDAVEEVTATSPERDEWSTPPASDDEEPVDPYAPSSLSQTAFHLITETFLPYKPDVVLIETQRWRSGGGPAIQQWTVRVNTLEGMLWALFTAFQNRPSQLSFSVRSKTELEKSYEIWGVDPRRVGAYWVGQEVKEEVSTKGKKSPRTKPAPEDENEFGPEVTEFQRTIKKSSRGKVEKKAKIDALRSWLRREPPATAPSVEPLAKGSPTMEDEEVPPAITFSFSEEAERTRTSLLAERAMLLQRKDKSVVKVSRKMDDVTDCFLQAAAWVAWESNRLRIKQDIEKREEEEAAEATQRTIEEPELVAKATEKSPKRKQTTRKASQSSIEELELLPKATEKSPKRKQTTRKASQSSIEELELLPKPTEKSPKRKQTTRKASSN